MEVGDQFQAQAVLLQRKKHAPPHDTHSFGGKNQVHPITYRTGAEGVLFYSFFDLGSRWDLVVNATPQPLSTQG